MIGEELKIIAGQPLIKDLQKKMQLTHLRKNC